MQPGLPLTRADSFIRPVRYSRKANTTTLSPLPTLIKKYINPPYTVCPHTPFYSSFYPTLMPSPSFPKSLRFGSPYPVDQSHSPPSDLLSRLCHLAAPATKRGVKADEKDRWDKESGSLLSSQSAMRYTYVREIKMQMHDSSCATQHLCMMGNFDLRCSSVGMYEVQIIKGRGETRSKAATCTKYIAASCKPFPSGLLRLPAPSWGPRARPTPIMPSPSINPCTLLLPRDLFGAHS